MLAQAAGPPSTAQGASGDTKAAAQRSAAGRWAIHALIGETKVGIACEIAQKELKLTGTCVAEQDDETGAARTLTGEVTEKALIWHFDGSYQGKPVTVSLRAVLDDAGTKMYGSIDVSPIDANGTFLAEKLPAVEAPKTP